MTAVDHGRPLLLVCAVGRRPIEVLRVITHVQPDQLVLLYSSASQSTEESLVAWLDSSGGLPRGSISSRQVDSEEVAPFGEGLYDQVAAMRGSVVIAATGATKPMIWTLQRWYDSLPPSVQGGVIAVDEGTGELLVIHREGPPDRIVSSLSVSLPDLAALHGLRTVVAGQTGDFASAREVTVAHEVIASGGKLHPDPKKSGEILERVVAQRLSEAIEGQWMRGVTAVLPQGRRFELDVVRIHGGRLWALECKHSKPSWAPALEDLAEVRKRVEQLGGPEGRAGLLTLDQRVADRIEGLDYLWVWNRPRAFGRDDAVELLDPGTDVAKSAIGEFFQE